MLAEAQTLVRRAFCDGLRPEQKLLVSEWADAHRMLSQKSSAEPGQWKTSRTPYMKEIMDCLGPGSPVQEVDLMAGAQLGKTEGGNNWFGFVVDHAPGPMLMVQPTVDLAKRLSKQRLGPMIEETPRLRERIADSKSRDSGNTMLTKEFPGGILVVTGANSAVGLRSMPARYLYLDEIDAFPGDIDGEGDPIQLALKRTSTFRHRRKVFMTSTPSIQGRSNIEKRYLNPRATQEIYLVPCPHCNHYQQLLWKGIKWEGVDAAGRPIDVRYICEACPVPIYEHEKTRMLARGRWHAQNEEADGLIRSFHISSLYSPVGWYGWDEAAQDWIDSEGDQEARRTFINTVLAETWKEKGERPNWEILYNNNRETYARNTVPKGGLVLVAGVDVQGNRIEVEVVAYGRRRESWSVDYRVFMGDPALDKTWEHVDSMLSETWKHESGAVMQIQKMAIDTGYMANRIYAWIRTRPIERVMAIKSQRLPTLVGHPRPVDVDWQGMKIARGTMLWSIGEGLAKEELYGWLRQPKPALIEDEGYPLGWCHFPQYEPEYFKQMCSEELVPKLLRGYRKFEWEKTRDRNEALDCRVYARVAASVVGIDRWNDEYWQLVEESLGVSVAPRKEPRARNRRGGYLDAGGGRRTGGGGYLG